MAEVTVSQFADVLKVPVDRLLTQLDEAGIKVQGADDIISDEAKMELLTHLRRAHGREEDAAAPRKITLKRKAQQEIKVASTQGRARTVNVEVRVKKTYLNRTVLEEEQRQRQEESTACATPRRPCDSRPSAAKPSSATPSAASASASRPRSAAASTRRHGRWPRPRQPASRAARSRAHRA